MEKKILAVLMKKLHVGEVFLKQIYIFIYVLYTYCNLCFTKFSQGSFKLPSLAQVFEVSVISTSR